MMVDQSVVEFYRPKSFSSGLMLGTTLFRNKMVVGRLAAELAYPAIACIAVIESVAAAAFTALTVFSPEAFSKSSTWLCSSTFTIIWALADAILNLSPYIANLVADEPSARMIFLNLKLTSLPPTALI